MQYLILLLLLIIMAILCAAYAAHMCAAFTDLDTYGGGQFTTVAIPTLLEFPKEYTDTDT